MSQFDILGLGVGATPPANDNAAKEKEKEKKTSKPKKSKDKDRDSVKDDDNIFSTLSSGPSSSPSSSSSSPSNENATLTHSSPPSSPPAVPSPSPSPTQSLKVSKPKSSRSLKSTDLNDDRTPSPPPTPSANQIDDDDDEDEVTPSNDTADSNDSAFDIEFADVPSESDELDFLTDRRAVYFAVDRYEWMEKQLYLRRKEYTVEKNILMYFGTYNVNGKKLNEKESLTMWVLSEVEKYGTADLYAFGFQEIVDLNAQSLLIDHSAAEPWGAKIQEILSSTGKEYKPIASVHLVGLALMVFVSSTIKQFVSDVRTATVGVGIMGVAGNKGAVVVRLNLFKSSICIVNSHLAAHQKNYKARNADYHSILKKCVLLPKQGEYYGSKELFRDDTNRKKMQQTEVESDDEDEGEREEEEAPPAGTPLPAASTAPSSSKMKSDFDTMKSQMWAGLNFVKSKIADGLDTLQPTLANLAANVGVVSSSAAEDANALTIHDHDHIFWIGDLNYRLDVADIGMEPTLALIDSKNWKVLLSYDQLIAQKKAKKSFVGFTEGKITFPPTYKYQTGTDSYDRREDKKARFPAYTDRIQWCSNDDSYSFHLLFYRRAELKMSDHKPVMALFSVPIKKETESKKMKIRHELEELSDKEFQCKLKFSSKFIELNDVRFDMPIVRKLVMKNVGKSVVQFKVESLNEDDSEEKMWANSTPSAAATTTNNSTNPFAFVPIKNRMKTWLSVVPRSGIVGLNGHRTITITVHIDRMWAHYMNIERETFTPLLVRVDGKKQYMIPFNGKYVKSTLGADPSFLAKLGVPMRTWMQPKKDPKGKDKSTQRPSSNSADFAIELVRLVDHIHSNNGLKLKNVWVPPEAPSSATSQSFSICQYEQIGKIRPRFNYMRMLHTPQIRYICECLDTGRPFDNVPTEEANASTPKPKLNALAGEVDLRTTLVRLPVQYFASAFVYWIHSLHKPPFYLPDHENAVAQSITTSGSSASNPFSSSSSLIDSSGGSSRSSASMVATDPTSWLQVVIHDIPPPCHRIFVYVLAFLREVLAHKNDNGSTLDGLAAIFAEPLTHKPRNRSFSKYVHFTPMTIIKHAIRDLN